MIGIGGERFFNQKMDTQCHTNHNLDFKSEVGGKGGAG